jgi:hypothetical protein
MKCKLIRTRLADYSARRLAPSEDADVRVHLDACNPCALFYREEAVLARGLEQLPAVEPSAALWARVSAGLDAPETRKGRSRFFGWAWNGRPIAALATSLAATAGLVAYVQFNAPSTPVNRGGTPTQVSNNLRNIDVVPGPSRSVNPNVDDPMADQMDTLFAAVDQMTRD